MKMKFLLAVLVACFLFPKAAGAVDYSITDVQINASLQENGTVQVGEQHTYEFKSKFKGIIREIVPKKGASIEQFMAYENDMPLQVEQKNNEYRVHRKGKKETITVQLDYEIKDGTEKYEDGVQFYWPFFDDRNESDYGNMTIKVIPPASASDVLFIGYDSAQDTGSLEGDGTVTFAMGEVEAGNNADVRVVYEPSLFPLMQQSHDHSIRPSVRADQQLQEFKKVQFAAMQDKLRYIGAAVFGAGLLVLSMISVTAYFRKRNELQRIQEELATKGFFIPDYDMSMPAILLYRNGSVSFELMAAALLDLVRKGFVKQLSEDEFELVNTEFDMPHEQKLAELLFFTIGQNEKLTLKMLKDFTKKKKNYGTFQKAYAEWKYLIQDEMRRYSLWNPRGLVMTFSILFGITGIVFSILLGVYELYIPMTMMILTTLYAFGQAIFYKPRNYAGHLLLAEWKRVEEWMAGMDPGVWDQLSLDDRFRVLVYGTGIKHPQLSAYYEAFAHANRELELNNPASDYGKAGGSYVYNPVFISQSFSQASSNVSSNAPSSSSGGGGTGGGGGGSGAF